MPGQEQTQKGRRDPKPRHVIGTKEARVEGKRPDRLYVLVHKFGTGGVADYEDAGYQIERYAGDGKGTHIRGVQRAKPGEPIEKYGHVLMSISIEDAKAFVAEQQAEADEIEQQIIKTRVGLDPLRGMGAMRAGHLNLESAGSDFTV